VTGDHDRGDLAGAGDGVAAALAVVALIEGDDDRVVALRPERGVRDAVYERAQVGVADSDQVLVLRVEDVAAVQAVRRIAVQASSLCTVGKLVPPSSCT